VTLSSWLRDYLYIPLGGNRKGEVRRDLNLLATMGLGGLWHGASFSFLAWGLWHGGLLAGHRHAAKLGLRIPAVRATAGTFVLVTIGWVFFRMRTPGAIRDVLGGMGGLHGVGTLPSHTLLALLALGAVLMWGVPEEWRWQLGTWGVRRVALVGVLAALAVVFLNSTQRFIYFKF
jgi:alginate O-acetyltransferase complex protein AlgI